MQLQKESKRLNVFFLRLIETQTSYINIHQEIADLTDIWNLFMCYIRHLLLLALRGRKQPQKQAWTGTYTIKHQSLCISFPMHLYDAYQCYMTLPCSMYSTTSCVDLTGSRGREKPFFMSLKSVCSIATGKKHWSCLCLPLSGRECLLYVRGLEDRGWKGHVADCSTMGG